MSEDDLGINLERAVRDAVAPPSPIRAGAEALCQLNGPRPGCYCGKGLWQRCHAVELYGDQATAVILALRRTGTIPRDVTDVTAVTAARALATVRAKALKAIAAAASPAGDNK